MRRRLALPTVEAGYRHPMPSLADCLLPATTARDVEEKRQAVEVKFGETRELTLMPDGMVNASATAAPQLAPLNQYQPKPQLR